MIGRSSRAAVMVAAVALIGPPWQSDRRPIVPPPEPPPAEAPAQGPKAPAKPRARAPVSADWRMPEPVRNPENGRVVDLDGIGWMSAADLGRLLEATKCRRSAVRQLVLRAGAHGVVLTVGNPFAVVDDHTVRLPAPVRSVRGEVHVPVALLESLPRDSSLARLRYDPGRRVVVQVPAAGLVGAPRLSFEGGATRLTFPVERPDEVSVVGRARAHFVLHFGGIFMGTLPDSMPPSSLVRSIRPLPAAEGTGFELAIAPEAKGFRVVGDPEHGRLTLVVSPSAGGGLEAFAPEGPTGPRHLRVVVIDPGHGGADHGVMAESLVEKDLTLKLALLVRAELARRIPARVILTREDDRALSVDERAERANRARADLVLALHFDGFPSGQARGATAFCPPATYAAAGGEEGGVESELGILPWREVSTRHAVPSRELSERILASLELQGLGPTRLREVLPQTLLGVNAPGLMLECGMLTSPADRERITRPEALSRLAAAIASGIVAYERRE